MLHTINIYSHIEEIKWRTIYSLVSYLFLTFILYIYIEPVLYLSVQPIFKDESQIVLIYTHAGEAFFSYLKLALYTSLILVGPFIIWNFYQFIVPGLYPSEVYRLQIQLISFVFLIVFTLIFFFIYIAPFIYQFFLSFNYFGNKDSMDIPLFFQPKINELVAFHVYLLFLSFLIVVFPCLLLLTPYVTSIAHHRHIYWISTLFLAGVLTPPDILSQLAIGFFLSLFLEIILFIYYLTSPPPHFLLNHLSFSLPIKTPSKPHQKVLWPSEITKIKRYCDRAV